MDGNVLGVGGGIVLGIRDGNVLGIGDGNVLGSVLGIGIRAVLCDRFDRFSQQSRVGLPLPLIEACRYIPSTVVRR